MTAISVSAKKLSAQQNGGGGEWEGEDGDGWRVGLELEVSGTKQGEGGRGAPCYRL